ncbi:MAG TPA: sulfite dehydrogenase [Candidatus Methylomirabilis sp.]|nr:sulfite dehydrogenase [Candidatus Methylomirabilis sp.]
MNPISAPDPGPRDSARRRFLKRGVALGAALAVRATRAIAAETAPDDPSKILGEPMKPHGDRSRFDTAVRQRLPEPMPDEWGGNYTPLDTTMGIITPAGLHYEVCHSGVPDIDPRKHRLMIHGMVDRPLMLTIDEIKRLPSTSRIYFLECEGNTRSEWWPAQAAPTVQFTHGLTSCSEWTGVALSLLLREAGVQKGASWIVAEGADGTSAERSIPLTKAMDDVLVVYGQNGEALRPGNGYPLRLVVPGWEGSVNAKWLRRIKVVDRPYMTRLESPRHTMLLPDGKARQFAFVMEAKSVITFPSGGQQLPGPGFFEIRGLAWSGRGLVRRVEVSTDGGQTWQDSRLQEPVLRFAHTRFRLDWHWDGRQTVLQSRCTDETGYVQPTLAELIKVRGRNSIFHNNAIQGWKVAPSGSVQNANA